MEYLKPLSVEGLQDYGDTELTEASRRMAQAARNPWLKETFQKHLAQVEYHLARLEKAFELLGGKAPVKTCKPMIGPIEESKEQIDEGKNRDEIIADLALINAAQKVEHYGVSGYGAAMSFASLIEKKAVASLLGQTLDDEVSADFLLTCIANPLLQEARMIDMRACEGDLELVRSK